MQIALTTKLEKVHRNIKYLRTRLDLSQRQLAEKTGLNRGNIASYEDEKKPATPSLTKLTKIANVFDISTEDLLNVEIDESNYDHLMKGGTDNSIISEAEAQYQSGKTIMDVIDELERKHPESTEMFSRLKSMIYKKEDEGSQRAQQMFDWFKSQLETLK